MTHDLTTATLDRDRPVDRWPALAAAALGAPAAVLCACDESELVLRGAFGTTPEEVERLRLLEPGGWCAQVQASDAPVLLPQAAGVGALAAVPVREPQRECRGVLLVLDHEPRAWSAEEVALLESVAEAAALHGRLDAERAARERTDAALQRNEAKFRALFDNGALGAGMVGMDGWLIRVNVRLREFLGGTEAELHYRPISDFVDPEDVPAARALFTWLQGGGKGHRAAELRFRAGGGRLRWGRVHVSMVRDQQGRPFCGLLLVEDVTQRKRAEEALRESQRQLILAQRLEAVGGLAGGIAHDFRNALTIVGSFAQLLQREIAPDSSAASYVAEIEKAAARATALTQQLLAFTRQQVLQMRRIDLNDVVAEAHGALRHLLGEKIELSTRLHPDLPEIHADPDQVKQVLSDLTLNARDAMPGGGRLTIETAPAELTEGDARRHSHSVDAGSYVRLRVRDSGLGMDAETLGRIFEPFFTTKEEGQGKGLGLATVYGIVKQSGGYIWAESREGEGSTFDVYLPVCTEERPAPEPAARVDPSRAPAASQTILLVEDESTIRALTRYILSRQGYSVVEAENGAEAIERFETLGGRVDLLLTDVVMPGMNGRVLAEQLLRRRADLRVLFMSGYTAAALEHYGFEPGTAFLDKPFTPDSLSSAVREVLAGS
ncbi:MAG TPA: ATP-binding protein [Longimicrobiaceae bacterium]|nr:ATP-binding protein [Longimicrobiaceae bacterium]